jgi:hypothetical protein
MTNQLEAARAMMDEHRRVTAEYRLIRAAKLNNRAERTTERARQALASLGA